MAIELDDMLCEADGTATPEHVLRWQDQSGQELAPLVIHQSYTKFPGAAFNVTGTVSIGSAVVASVSTVGRIVVGMSVTGTGIPAATTVASVDSASQFTMSAVGNGSATGAPITINVNGVGTITVADPVINFGYNTKGGGAPIDLAKGSAYFQIEGNYDRGATGDVWGEAFITFKGPGSTGPARPLFFGYDWEQNRVVNGSVTVGLGQSFGIGFNDYISQGTSGGHRFDENRYTLFKASEETAEASQIRVGAHANQAAEIILADNDDDPAVRQKFKFRMAPGAASVTDGEMTISMYDNNATPASRAIKTGKIFFNASTASDTIRMGIGKNNFNTTDIGILNVYVENGLTSNTGIYVKAKTSQTGSLLRLDGINNGTGVAEVATWTVRPRGEIVVRESGNTSTDRPPTAGSGGPTAFPTAANKPGTAIGIAGVTWFPMLDTSGALFWVPGWSA